MHCAGNGAPFPPKNVPKILLAVGLNVERFFCTPTPKPYTLFVTCTVSRLYFYRSFCDCKTIVRNQTPRGHRPDKLFGHRVIATIALCIACAYTNRSIVSKCCPSNSVSLTQREFTSLERDLTSTWHDIMPTLSPWSTLEWKKNDNMTTSSATTLLLLSREQRRL